MQEGYHNREVLKDIALSVKDTSISIAYTKTNKLVTALYMVTDMLDGAEPMRHKLRLLGVEIVSDIHSLDTENVVFLSAKISQNIKSLLSFLEMSLVLNMISEMNYNILKKEFTDLHNAVNNLHINPRSWNGANSLSEFLSDNSMNENFLKDKYDFSRTINKGHTITNIGMQKGSTLLSALKGYAGIQKISHGRSPKEEFDLVKKERRFEIIRAIKVVDAKSVNGKNGATIKDIKDNANIVLKNTSEKTLQRELISMVHDGVLYKTGEKRWSKYFIKL